MNEMKETARRAVGAAALKAAIVDLDAETRQELRALLDAGDRTTVHEGEVELGAVRMNKPRKSWRVSDWSALLRWVKIHHPNQIHDVPTIHPSYVRQLCKTGEAKIETADPATGEVIEEVVTPDGIEMEIGTPTLVVTATDAAVDAARTMLSRTVGEIES